MQLSGDASDAIVIGSPLPFEAVSILPAVVKEGSVLSIMVDSSGDAAVNENLTQGLGARIADTMALYAGFGDFVAPSTLLPSAQGNHIDKVRKELFGNFISVLNTQVLPPDPFGSYPDDSRNYLIGETTTSGDAVGTISNLFNMIQGPITSP